MNYYERYCGDYGKKTSHLDLRKHGAYTLMLDDYYAKEKPLPADYESLYRICRAMSAKEREAVRLVAEEFFPVNGDGLRHNQRADEVLKRAWKRIHSARLNGEKGGRPRKPTGIDDENPPGFQQQPTGVPSTKAPHTPTPTTTKSKTLSGKPDGEFERFYAAYPRKTKRRDAEKSFRRLKPDNSLMATMLAALEAHKATEQWQRGVIPHAATWLNQRRWEDDVASLPSLGECTWNVHGNREEGRPKCAEPAVVEKHGLAYCKEHGGRV